MSAQLVLSDGKGQIFVHPTLKLLGFDGVAYRQPAPEELVNLPKGSTLFFMPHHVGIGFDQEANGEVCVEEFGGRKVFAVSAFMVPGYTRLYLPAALKRKKDLILPLWPYTAVGWKKGRFCVCAAKVDSMRRQMPFYYQCEALIKKQAGLFLKKFPKNRLIKHLGYCALTYHCRNAQNLFLGRWEAPLPVSPACNAKCLGCISSQDSDCLEASHERIRFVPSVEEIVEIALVHLRGAREGIVSFGQGCEGEPLLQFSVIRDAIRLIRQRTRKGTIHLNTNGFHPAHLEELAKAGLDSVRISLNSFDEKTYEAYYRPSRYGHCDVLASVAIAKKSGLFVSLNLLTFPGLTDNSSEVKRLICFLKKGYCDLLQLRNLSIDPAYLLAKMPVIKGEPLGILALIKQVKKLDLTQRIGYFNVPKERFVWQKRP
ncbi:MAG: radical SAM protein [Candidatus Omnitrophota bacterium]